MSNCNAHYVFMHKDRIIMPKELTIQSRNVKIPEKALLTPYGYWFPLNLLCLDLYGIIAKSKFTPAILRNIDGVLVAPDGLVYSIQYGNDTLDCWPIMWDDDGFYIIPSRRGIEDALHSMYEIDPTMSPHDMLDIAAEIILIRAGDRYEFSIKKLIDELKVNVNIVPVKELFSDISSMNSRMTLEKLK